MTSPRRGQPRVGQLKISGILSSEPAGRPIREAVRGECLVTYDAGAEDDEIQRRHGLIGLRRAKLQRIATEAHDQGIDLTQQDLARILGVALKTIKRDIAFFRRHGTYVPTRGQQKALGPIVPHEIEAVRLSLEGRSVWDVSGRILHSPGTIRGILDKFARVVGLLQAGTEAADVGRQVGVPRRLVLAFGRLAAEAARNPAQRGRLDDLLRRREPAGARLPSPADGQVRGVGRRRPPIFDDQVSVLRSDVFRYMLEVEVRRAARYGLPLSVITVEPVGRGPGAPAGTLASKTLAELLRAQLRSSDLIGRQTVARYLVLLPLTDAPAARRVLDRLQQAPGVAHGLRAGVASFPTHGSQAADLLRKSTRALAPRAVP